MTTRHVEMELEITDEEFRLVAGVTDRIDVMFYEEAVIFSLPKKPDAILTLINGVKNKELRLKAEGQIIYGKDSDRFTLRYRDNEEFIYDSLEQSCLMFLAHAMMGVSSSTREKAEFLIDCLNDKN